MQDVGNWSLCIYICRPHQGRKKIHLSNSGPVEHPWRLKKRRTLIVWFGCCRKSRQPMRVGSLAWGWTQQGVKTEKLGNPGPMAQLIYRLIDCAVSERSVSITLVDIFTQPWMERNPSASWDDQDEPSFTSVVKQ